MKLKKYISDCWKETFTPFISDTMIDNEASFVYDDEFQNDLSNYIYRKHGNKEISEMILEEVAETVEKDIEDLTMEDIYQYIVFVCDNIYKTNQYKYNTLEATTHLDYNPIENYNRIDEFNNIDDYGGTTNKTVEGNQSVNNTYGAIQSSDEYGQITKNVTKGEQENIQNFGRQSEDTTYGQERETIEHGEINKNTNLRDEVGNKTDSTTHGATTETNTYGAKENTIGKVVTENTFGNKSVTIGEVETTNTYGEKVINVGGIRTVDDFGNKVEDNNFGAIHTEMQEVKSTGISSYDVVGDFGDGGISKQSNNYVVGTSGDDAYNPKERQRLEHAENTDEHTDTKTIHPYTDIHSTSNQQNVEDEHIDTNVVGEHTNTEDEHTDTVIVGQHTDTEAQHIDTKGTTSYTDSTTYGGHLETHTNSEHTDQEDDRTTKDEHKDVVNRASHTDVINEGERTDIETVNTHNDTHTQGSHTDTTSVSGKETSSIIGDRRDRHLIDGRSHGNIGVTTTQKLISEERKIALFSIYEIIARDIISQIACTVY